MNLSQTESRLRDANSKLNQTIHSPVHPTWLAEYERTQRRLFWRKVLHWIVQLGAVAVICGIVWLLLEKF